MPNVELEQVPDAALRGAALSCGGSPIIGLALAMGAVMGAVAQIARQIDGPLGCLGAGVAFWVTVGFLIARRAARTRGLLDGSVWAGTVMAVYLGSWLLAYCGVFGLREPTGFGAAWLDERYFFIIAPVASAILGLIAALSVTRGWLGDMCLAAPIAWALPEVGMAISQGWQYAAVVALPTVALAIAPPVLSRSRGVNTLALGAGLVGGGIVMYVLLGSAVDLLRWGG